MRKGSISLNSTFYSLTQGFRNFSALYNGHDPYQAKGEISKSDKTRTAHILTGLKRSSSCELIDKVIFKINLV